MALTYEMIQNATMSISQCNGYLKDDARLLGVLCLVLVAVLVAMLLVMTFKYVKMKNFIKEKKLQKSFQEFKNDNKGLD
jgi:uncharacterized membrane-anchored protein